MGAGKTTVGREVAELTQRPFVDTDAEVEKRHGSIAAIFDERGEAAFRELEKAAVLAALASPEPAVIALGGGAVTGEDTREALARHALTAHVEVDADTAWSRSRASARPLAREEGAFRRLFDERQPLYRETADVQVRTAEDVLHAALGVVVGRGALSGAVYDEPVALVADAHVRELHPVRIFPRIASTHVVPRGETAKRLDVVARLWGELRIDRSGTVAALGGGCTTDVAGFAAATFMRGVRWIALPTTLVGQIDAAIGGKTGIDLEIGKNLAGAFHYPAAVVVDPDVLSTLPDRERRNGMAEVVKTGLLAGAPLWELPEEEMIRGCAAFKCAVCLADPYERTGRRAILNLGHTFAHALEAASDYALPHGEAVALGLAAALRLSGQPTDVVEEILQPQPARADRDRAWEAMKRDKKAEGGRVRLVLLDAPGKPAFPVELPDVDVRRELDRLIAQ
ncbi:MAG: bifunctional shikimate kinase/3-dehydroquinate synthase [Actinobacteria bacterium]|nr:bifunctional shikimate kinase/3-dehydroquinate synthase [Actinomycetota bacterium]